MIAPETRPLARELAEGRIRSALLCHVHDRWYLGEMLCHASWVTCLQRAGIRVSVCTNPAYLELFEHHPAVDRLYPASEVEAALRARHDLVVFATTHPPAAHRGDVTHAVYAWNTGMSYARRGLVEWSRGSGEFNLFAATCHRHGDTALPDGGGFAMHLRAHEPGAGWLRAALGRDGTPVLVVNPTASNPITRQSDRPKAVDNQLEADDYAALMEHLLNDFPGHRLLVAAALKPRDETNLALMRALGARFSGHPRVRGVAGHPQAERGISLRAFAALLTDPRVEGMVGNSTGSNAHLAAACEVPALSIERAAGDEMRANWADPARGQMGSFRWRNPHPLTAAYTMRWEGRSGDDLGRVSRSFHAHMMRVGGDWEALFGARARQAHRQAAALLRALDGGGRGLAAAARGLAASLANPGHADAFFDFRDEADYLRITGRGEAADALDAITGARPPAEAPSASALDVLRRMIESSNLVKLARALSAPAPLRPGSARRTPARGRRGVPANAGARSRLRRLADPGS